MTKNTRPRSEAFKKMLADEYLNSNISIRELSEKYHTDAYYQLTRYGITLKGRGLQKILSRKGCIEYKWDGSSITNEEQAYSLGFLFADGYNNGKQAGLKVKFSDLDILKRIKDCFSEEIKIQKESNSFSFVISSASICSHLRNLGLIEQKSHNEKNLPSLNDELIRHFIRGYFDGDGTVFVCKNKNNPFLKCNICSSTINILEQIQDILTNNGIVCTINKEVRKGKTFRINNQAKASVASMDMFRLFIRRKHSIERFFHYMYDGATIYLSRKHKVFEDNEWMLNYRHANTELIK